MKGFPAGTTVLPLDYPHPMSGDLTAERYLHQKGHWYVVARCKCGRFTKVPRKSWESPGSSHPRPERCRECYKLIRKRWRMTEGTRAERAAKAAKAAPVIIRDAAHARELLAAGDLPHKQSNKD